MLEKACYMDRITRFVYHSLVIAVVAFSAVVTTDAQEVSGQSKGRAKTKASAAKAKDEGSSERKEDAMNGDHIEEVAFTKVNAEFPTARFTPRRDAFSKPSDFDFSEAKTTDNSIKESETTAPQQDSGGGDTELAQKLSNPVASLISVPFQNNFDFGMGPDKKGFRYTLNFQPVIPIALNKDWNLISRTILPIIYQNKVANNSSQFGLGDITQSFFFSPNKSKPFVWGLGPVLNIPTATNKYLGTQKLGIGPTGLILKQQGQWTVGFLAFHTWSVAGKSTRADVSLTFAQPFVSYTTKTAWTIGVNTESTYEWNSKTAGIPVNFSVSKLTKFGKRPVSLGAGLKCWARSTPGGPRYCGFRLIITPLFPK